GALSYPVGIAQAYHEHPTDTEGSYMATSHVHTWEIWYPGAAATGLQHARARIDPTDVV
ncbi:MAG: hypothetical protein H0U86_14330, partial [Chloroflexi bacterium]|nr:hypothetical protein [Chloroflexota bacterium]